MERQSNRIVGILTTIAIAVMAAASTVSCGSKAGDAGSTKPVEILYNPAVESFTAGTLGRKAPVSVTLTDAISSDARLGKYIEISPRAKGEWAISDEDPRTLIFTPSPEFGRGTLSTVTMDLKGLLPGNPEARKFSFSFKTLPAEASAELSTLTVEPD